MIAISLAIALVVIAFIVGPIAIACASRRADRDDPVPTEIVDDALAAFHERRAS